MSEKRIEEKIGFGILSDAGIDVYDRVDDIIEKQLEQKKKLIMESEKTTVYNKMTSELVYLSETLKDVYGTEYTRRLKLLGFSDEQVHELYLSEKEILAIKDDEGRQKPWVRRHFINPGSTLETMPEPDEIPLSELILITDDANAALWRDHEWLPEDAMKAVYVAACSTPYTADNGAKYIKEYNKRTEEMEWVKGQSSAYLRNECLLTERFKWGMHQNPAWIKKTIDLTRGELTPKQRERNQKIRELWEELDE